MTRRLLQRTLLVCMCIASLPLVLAASQSESSTTAGTADLPLHADSRQPHAHLHAAVRSIVDSHGGAENVKLGVHRSTGYINQLILLQPHTPSSGHTSSTLSFRSPEQKARDFFERHGEAFGIPKKGAPDSAPGARQAQSRARRDATTAPPLAVPSEGQLVLSSEEVNSLTGKRHLKFRQSIVPAQEGHEPIEVFGGSLQVSFDSFSEIASVVGQYVHDAHFVDQTDVRVSPQTAIAAARAFLVKTRDADLRYAKLDGSFPTEWTARMELLHVDEQPKFTIYDLGLLQGSSPSSDPSQPVVDVALCYQLILRTESASVHERLFVSALTGAILAQHPMNNRVSSTVSRRVQETTAATLTPQTRWTEGDTFPTSKNAFNQMILAAGETFNLYASMSQGTFLGWDNLNTVFTSVLDTAQRLGSCPNAFFDGTQAVFCSGLTADDVIAHEWSHGYTQSTSGLVYKYQAGALNEAWSDIMGEVVDLLNARGTDAPDLPRTVGVCINGTGDGTRWLVGEDATAFGGAIRDMYNPACMLSPDTGVSSYYECSGDDNGGVHTNSGVINRLFAFLADGAVIDGQSIAGVGLTKAAHICWNAQRYYLSSVSDFNSVAGELYASCLSLVGTAVPDISTKPSDQWPTTRQPLMSQSDCAQINTIATVLKLRANKCNKQQFIDASPPVLCPAGTSPAYFLSSSFDLAPSLSSIGWSETANVSLPATWNGSRWNISRLGGGRVGRGVFVADPNPIEASGFCQFSQSALMTLSSPVVTIPAAASRTTSISVAFDHYFATEPGYDGGNLYFSVNGSTPTFLPASYITFNPYTNPIVHDTVTNFLSDQPAWTGTAGATASGGVWATSVIHFPTSIVSPGSSLQLHFRFGTDFCAGAVGWYIDEVRVFQCVVDHCPGNTCPTNSQCVETLDSYTCECTHGYTGPNCDIAPTLYQWKMNATSACSAACGGGVMATTSYCARIGDDVLVDDIFCLLQADPILTQPLPQSACNTDRCPYLAWVYSPWEPSATCGFGVGTEVRTVNCQLITMGIGMNVTDDQCSAFPQELLSQPLLLDECRGVYEYHVSHVSECSPACGPTSVRTRTIGCRRSADLVTVDSSFCSALNLIPPMPTMPCRYVPDCITLE